MTIQGLIQQCSTGCPLTLPLVYSIAGQTLHMAADLLLDAYEALEILPDSSPCSDQRALFTVSYVRELAMLALEVSTANKHWEKVLQLATRLDTLVMLVLRALSCHQLAPLPAGQTAMISWCLSWPEQGKSSFRGCRAQQQLLDERVRTLSSAPSMMSPLLQGLSPLLILTHEAMPYMEKQATPCASQLCH